MKASTIFENLKVQPKYVYSDRSSFILRTGKYWFNFSIKNEKISTLTEASEEGQFEVIIDDYKLKQARKVGYNSNNTGRSPLERDWDNDVLEIIPIDSIVRIKACEYGVGDGGSICFGKWVSPLTTEEADELLKVYRKKFLNLILK